MKSLNSEIIVSSPGKNAVLISCLIGVFLVITSCSILGEFASATTTPSPPPTQTNTLPPSPTSTLLPAPSHTPIPPDTGWDTIQPGLERRVIHFFDEQGQVIETLFMLRIEPSAYRFGIAYHEEPQTLTTWLDETNALIVINGGFFRTENGALIPTGLTVVNGQVIGESYDGFAGMLAITDAGPELRWLEQQPYDPNEPLIAALQSFPLLVKPGGAIGFPEQFEDHQQARRTVIGRDTAGHILLMIASEGYFTLHQISKYLTESNLNLDIAINLDGGPSSGLILAEPYEEIPALSPLPVVITIHER